jgi:hypothetical protein
MLKQARQTIEGTLVVMAHLENRQSQIVRDHSHRSAKNPPETEIIRNFTNFT